MREPLQDLARTRPALQVRILVDALDEALAADGITIVDLIAGSGDLPDGVRWVLTTRREPEVTDEFDGAATVSLSGTKHLTAADADLQNYIAGRLASDARPEPPPGPGDTLEQRLLERADSNFLYAKWVLDEMAEHKQEAPDIDHLPQGLYGLYRVFLDRLIPPRQFKAEWEGRHEPFLGCLVVATPLAPMKRIPSWLAWSQAQLNVELAKVAQLVEYVADAPPGEDGFRLYHGSMADFLTADTYREDEELKINRYHVEPAEQHDRIASHYLDLIDREWSGDWTRSDSYGLRELVGHLRGRVALGDDQPSRSRLDDLYAVALDDDFHAAQRTRLGGIHAGLSDLRATLDTALARPGAEDVIQALRCVAALRRTTRAEALSHAVSRPLPPVTSSWQSRRRRTTTQGRAEAGGRS